MSPHIRELVEMDFESRPEVRDGCLRVVEFIEANHRDQLRHLSYAALKRISGVEHEAVIALAQYLSGARMGVLEMKFEFICGNYISEVEPAVLRQARLEGRFYHPKEGRPVDDFESCIFMYFAPGHTVDGE
ncbi:hypothetical protein RDV84_23835 [Lysobacter yananisis]|uniref:Uncharacterized protein n=1 Tax=Lysobacter yananisis TaxID=1003114 RepID=A0ABY9P7G2_9GAMM|nr:hypothetical protein [Lysobacter yananisis]WMT02957.1 hypothetical protein RDV84_23835 [Lysobacter yananisis]